MGPCKAHGAHAGTSQSTQAERNTTPLAPLSGSHFASWMQCDTGHGMSPRRAYLIENSSIYGKPHTGREKRWHHARQAGSHKLHQGPAGMATEHQLVSGL